MTQTELYILLEELQQRLPSFNDGRIDYTHSDIAPVVTGFVMHDNKLLLVRRSNEVNTYKGMWSSIGGYIDEIVPVKSKILEELREELGILEHLVESLEMGTIIKTHDEQINKTWLIHPVLIRLKDKPEIVLDWEHTEYQWINKEDLAEYELLPDTLVCWNTLKVNL